MKADRSIPVRVVDGGGALYAKEPKVYPREVTGRFQRLRVASVFWLLGMFYLFPWISLGGQQLVLFDLPARRFHLFGLTFWPQDFYLLTMLLVIAALTLFFFTALAGRLWCGYACPQTVWTEVFLWIERRIEGDRNARMKLDKAPWTRAKFARKAAKQAAWVTFAAWTGFTFVGFFTPIRELSHEVATASLGGWEAFWIVFYGFATYGNAGFLREQVCKYMCPYARFQSAMFDRDTLVISYDSVRGEPRGHRKRSSALRAVDAVASSTAARPLGDCIDCLACVQVCPTGIDIRNGLQIECIACAACIDACDAVMDKMQYARGLIRYTTEHALAGTPQRVVRPRTLAYAAILVGFVGAFFWAVAARAPVIVEVLHDRNALFRTVAHGAIENGYSVKLLNKTDAPVTLSVRPSTDLPLRIVGRPSVTLSPGEVFSLPMTLRAAADGVHGRHAIDVVVSDAQGSTLAHGKAHFFAPEAP
ncbi:cytochrome c oxidase accessory protein CcoG [Dokdonella sp. MW10]|uniref:cytochrome c oxidase accessory protein CcoG n=1 Tax=Dokdonella sp. MW10 TaxID=2992926 RepID=UPI003F7E6E16